MCVQIEVNGDSGLGEPGAKKPRRSNGVCESPPKATNAMTSKDYYFDSYSHFGMALLDSLL